MLNATAARPKMSPWLAENGPREVELLFRSITYNQSLPILLIDDDRQYCDTSRGAVKLLGISRAEVLGRKIDDSVPPDFRRRLPEVWRDFLQRGEQEGTLPLVAPDGSAKDLEYVARKNVLPAKHVLVLRDTLPQVVAGEPVPSAIPAWLSDYAVYITDSLGCVAAWYAGASRIYGYSCADLLGREISLLQPMPASKTRDDLERAAIHGHLGTERWQTKKDGSRFWANVITAALRDESGELQGFGIIARDFTERHETNEKQRRSRAGRQLRAEESAIGGIVFAEFEYITEANDTFLKLVGYSREELAAGKINWLDLTPHEYAGVDGQAHEEELQFGASAPYEKELLAKDGSRLTIQIATAILKLCPFRWIAFVRDLSAVDCLETEANPNELEQDFKEMVGNSTALKRVLRQIELVAPTTATVLLMGETGTGKELVARAIHRLSPRNAMPCITLNCAAIPTGLLESELFGYERGAFTGALSQKIGRFEMAHRGTLFLDEVGDIPLELQPKLLRALQEKSFERLGGTRTIPIDVRLVAATNRNLAQMMGDKLFRSDLYYRLKVFPITLPPLRDRPEDIPLLTKHFTKKYAEKMNRKIDRIPGATVNALVRWRWPGNVRELENFVERAVILSRGPELRAPLGEIQQDAVPVEGGATLEQIEREHILRVFRESNGVVTTAAIRLGLHRTTLNAMMRKLNISRTDL